MYQAHQVGFNGGLEEFENFNSETIRVERFACAKKGDRHISLFFHKRTLQISNLKGEDSTPIKVSWKELLFIIFSKEVRVKSQKFSLNVLIIQKTRTVSRENFNDRTFTMLSWNNFVKKMSIFIPFKKPFKFIMLLLLDMILNNQVFNLLSEKTTPSYLLLTKRTSIFSIIQLQQLCNKRGKF